MYNVQSQYFKASIVLVKVTTGPLHNLHLLFSLQNILGPNFSLGVPTLTLWQRHVHIGCIHTASRSHGRWSLSPSRSSPCERWRQLAGGRWWEYVDPWTCTLACLAMLQAVQARVIFTKLLIMNLATFDCALPFLGWNFKSKPNLKTKFGFNQLLCCANLCNMSCDNACSLNL